MKRHMNHQLFVLSVVMGSVLMIAGPGQADTLGRGHSKVNGVVIADQGGILKVETPSGHLTLTQNNARQHGHAAFQVGDEVTMVVDANNAVIEAHPKGEEGQHHFYTGRLVYMGKMNKAIKLVTAEGEKVFPLGRLEIKTKPIDEGTVVTVEVNEGGTVIDLRRADG
jgi:hypothetical protein